MPLQPSGWIPQLLHALGAPLTQANEQFLAGWFQEEHRGRPTGGFDQGGAFNPFDTSLSEPGSTSYNSVGVQSYPSWAEGLKATVSTLTEPAYAGLLGDLRSGASYNAIATAENNSPWNGGSVYSPINWGNFLAAVPSWETQGGGKIVPGSSMGGTKTTTKATTTGAFGIPGLPSSLDPFSGVANDVSSAFNFLTTRLPFIILGVIIFVVGIVVLSHSEAPALNLISQQGGGAKKSGEEAEEGDAADAAVLA